MNAREITNQIKTLQDQLKEVQRLCPHPESYVEKTHGANTGNYDPSADCYWTDFFCHNCLKRWREDGSK